MNKIVINTWADKAGKNAKYWGDYWAKYHLEAAFRTLGQKVVKEHADISIDLYGSKRSMHDDFPRGKYKIMWFYSHPDYFDINVAMTYDMVLCLSMKWFNIIRKKHRNTVYFPACTHCVLPPNRKLIYNVVFIGNARAGNKYGRQILDHLGPRATNVPLNLVGFGYNRYPAAKRYLMQTFWPNLKVNKLYGRSRISLSDVAVDMQRDGFIPFRIFDIVASGGFCITPKIDGIKDIFGQAVVQYRNPQDLRNKVKYFLRNTHERVARIEEGLTRVNKHTYLNRVREILAHV